MSLVATLPAPMLRKRKSVDEDYTHEYMPVFHRAIKHPRRLEHYQMDSDHAMMLPSAEPDSRSDLFSVTHPSSLPSSAESSPVSEYPLFQLYPDLPDPNAMDVDQSAPDSPNQEPVGLLGLQALGDKHNSCTQLPRLQIANYPGLEGRRAMFSQCMQCGGISQVTTL